MQDASSKLLRTLANLSKKDSQLCKKLLLLSVSAQIHTAGTGTLPAKLRASFPSNCLFFTIGQSGTKPTP